MRRHALAIYSAKFVCSAAEELRNQCGIADMPDADDLASPTPRTLASSRIIGCGPAGSFLQPLPLGRFDLGDLLPDLPQPLERPQQLGQDVWRQRLALRGAQHRQALRHRLAMPCSASSPFMRLTRRVASSTRRSRSRKGRLPSSASRLGTATMLQCFFSPRSQPRGGSGFLDSGIS
jgi:hypothetical protein